MPLTGKLADGNAFRGVHQSERTQRAGQQIDADGLSGPLPWAPECPIQQALNSQSRHIAAAQAASHMCSSSHATCI